MYIEKMGKITQKGQLTMPITIRKKINIDAGDRLKIIVDDNGETKIEVIKSKKLSDVYGVLGKPKQNNDLSIEEAIRISREQRGGK